MLFVGMHANIANSVQKKVLLHGESAGAIDSFTIASLEQAPKLFSSAIFESGGGLEVSLPEAVENISTSLAQNLKCSTTDVGYVPIATSFLLTCH